MLEAEREAEDIVRPILTTMRNFIICTHPQISLGKSSQGE
jgi:hypothetical protein